MQDKSKNLKSEKNIFIRGVLVALCNNSQIRKVLTKISAIKHKNWIFEYSLILPIPEIDIQQKTKKLNSSHEF